MKKLLISAIAFAMLAARTGAAELADDHSAHDHPVPDRLGTVHFANSCAKDVQPDFERAVALLHSFAYAAAGAQFRAVATADQRCAMAHWGIAMSVFHQLWSPPGAQDLQLGAQELQAARGIDAVSRRERELIDAAAVYFRDQDPSHHAARALAYAQAMETVAQHFPKDVEVQVFYALSLLGTASPSDRTHANQKRAAAILETVYHDQPDHPGAAHYLIHAYDSSELAPRGLPAARAYSKIAPSAPHALHMPSHIFTRLGLWDDSIASNEAARLAAHRLGDVGEELHAMDYLTYADLQRGRDSDAEHVVADLRAMGPLLGNDFKVGYAATAMPVRLAVERQRWDDALALTPLPGSAPHVAALVHWAHALAHAHRGGAARVDEDIAALDACEAQARSNGDGYWAAQIQVLVQEARAWRAYAGGQPDDAVAQLRSAADAEDALEKLPVTPGPIVPAREQLGALLLELRRPTEALRELRQDLKDAPGRRGGLEAAARAADSVDDVAAAAGFRSSLQN